jgi:hypothetical protein
VSEYETQGTEDIKENSGKAAEKYRTVLYCFIFLPLLAPVPWFLKRLLLLN